MTSIKEIISINNDILHGTPVFVGTRVPVQSLFWHLEKGISLEDFLEDFPSVLRSQVVALLQIVEHSFSSEQLIQRYENIA